LTEIVAVDIGGTHARFALARVEKGRVAHLSEETTFKTAEHAGLQTAWEEYGRRLGRPLPSAAGIAIAASVQAGVLKLTNSHWVIHSNSIQAELGTELWTLVNDFGAIAHAVAQLDPLHFDHLCGPDRDLPNEGVITVIGPGTGLGVAQLLRRDGRYHVVETEGGHIDYAPLDALEDRILAHLRTHYRRVSIERIASGQGLSNIYEALAVLENRPAKNWDEQALWQAAMSGEDSLAAAAFDRFCRTLGAAAGDIALAQGATAVVIAGGLGQRIAGQLSRSGFRDRFIAKGRFARRMEEMPVKIISHPQPGLFGAAAAFAEKHGA